MFEPDPANIVLIERTLEDARLDGIELLPVAVSDSRREALFHADPVAGTTGTLEHESESFARRHWGRTRAITVQAVALDDLPGQAEGLDLLKIDVEGHEERVIQGAWKTLARHRPIVVYECFHGGSEISERLASLEYLVLDADRRRASDECTTNFVAIPSRYFDRSQKLMDSWRRNTKLGPKRGT
jgi:FkbM family methyltransferase